LKPWRTIDCARTAEGELVLQQRGTNEFVIARGGMIVMSSRATRSEQDLAALVCQGLEESKAAHVVVAGLGMGFTLQAALAALPAGAKVTVVELTPAVTEWCRGPLSALAGGALEDRRVTVVAGDVFAALRDRKAALDGIMLDLWQGPHERRDPVFTPAALATCRKALAPGGRLGIWSEQSVGGFEQRLTAAGFTSPRKNVAKRGFRHVVYVATAPGAR
jgi:spermidine synthase